MPDRAAVEDSPRAMGGSGERAVHAVKFDAVPLPRTQQ
ncbi:hypothetical protein SBD_3824 [Streptomyces bottropensis ATCC 25435]|uniref:Uncharacterized protein n=1 Tax=Streptomyces bottropensis ATCC 25435 TaxID=1054862 RepID=M3FPV7_9ACTN|nr:hypothetical protein SBD_3824 [Streptomyces bottropensis ATCC 25435]